MARPSKYDFILCEEICKEVQGGKNIKAVLSSSDKYPSFPTWCKWKRDNTELLNLYVNAREDKVEAFEEEIDEVKQELREGKIEASAANVIIQTLKWKMAKFYPKMYGDRQTIEHDTAKGITSIKIEMDSGEAT